MPVFVNIKDKRWEAYKIDFEKIVKNSLILKNKGAELTITLTNDSEIQKLNKEYRGKDKPTNVLSFETGDPDMLGDIFISFDTAMNESNEKDFINHATHLIVHGVLHLEGFDHIDNKDAFIMQNKEIEILKSFGIRDPYKKKYKFPKLAMFLLGAIGSFGFAPYYLWFLTAIAIGAAYYFSKGYKTGFWFGAGYGVFNFHWSLESIFASKEIAEQFWYFYPIGLISLAVLFGFIFGLPFHMTEKTNSKGWRRVLYFALAWAFVLWLREWIFTGFPWNPIANIALSSVHISNLMSIIGTLGLTFIIVGAIVSVPEYIKTRSKLQFLFFIPIALSFLIPIKKTELTDYSVRIISPNLTMDQKFDKSSSRSTLNNLISMSNIESKVDLIVWPETSFPYLIDKTSRMPPMGSNFVTGAVYYENGKVYNSMILSDDAGNIKDVYFKFHLVPFGEYRPFGDIIPTPGQLSAGDGPKVIGNFVPAICYEIIFSDSLVPNNAHPSFILNITNDAWFGKSSGPWQHLDMARRQAIESGLPVVRANNFGVSAIIDSNGRIVKSFPMDTVGVLDGFIPKSKDTIYRHIGLSGSMIIIILLSGLILFFSRKNK